MNTGTTTSPNPSVVLPLQPESRAPVGIDLSASDRSTLRRAIGVLKAARADAKSTDTRVAREASQRLANILCYIAGFLDGKAVGTAGLNSGFQSILQSSLVVVTDPEAQLDELIKNLEAALEPGATRFWNIVAGLGLIALGIALKQL
jgi:hypothetical protein